MKKWLRDALKAGALSATGAVEQQKGSSTADKLKNAGVLFSTGAISAGLGNAVGTGQIDSENAQAILSWISFGLSFM